ncbi:hypothetical protein Hanom_Chr13g01194211 [Helianthus anomalus]
MICLSISEFTESNIDKFCADYGIDPSLEALVPGERTANQCLLGFLAFYTWILDQLKLRYPFTNFFLEVLKYYRLSLGQLAPVGVTQCAAPLLSATVGHTYAWKNQFFFISEWLLPFIVVPRKFTEVLNEKDSDVHELEWELLLRLRAYSAKLRAHLKELLVMLGIGQDWVESGFEPVFFLNQEDMCFCVCPIFYLSDTHVVPICFAEMSALDYILLNDPSNVEIDQKEIPEGGPSIVYHTEHVRTTGNLESVPIQPIMDSSSAKKKHAPSCSGDEDDANLIASITGVKLVKHEVPEASGGAGDAVQVSGEAKVSKIVLKKKVQEGSSKPVPLGDGFLLRLGRNLFHLWLLKRKRRRRWKRRWRWF